MSNLVSRIITSIILLPVVITIFILGGIFLTVFLAIVCLLCCYEIANIIHPQNTRALFFALIIGISVYLPLVLNAGAAMALLSLFIVFLIVNLFVLFTHRLDAEEFEKLSAIFFWCIYVTFAVLSVYWMIITPLGFTSRTGLSLVYLACLATWGNDTFAYFGGRLFGKHPLFPSVSAKKTWEGFFSGAIFSILGIFLLRFLGQAFSLDIFSGLLNSDILWITVPAVILAPLGDLIESRLKRLYDTKDSSNILPGHGGLLDRIDALLLTLPWTAVYAFIIRPIW